MATVSLMSLRKLRSARVVSSIVVIRIATATALLAIYEGVAQSGLFYKDVIPSLVAVGRALLVLLGAGDFYPHFGLTAFEMAMGFAIGTLVGLGLGIAFGLWRLLGEALDPWCHYLAPTPKIIFLPVIILLFGTGIASKIALGALSAFFPVVVATFAAMRLVRPVLVRVAKTFQASTWQTVKIVHLPSLLVPVIGAMRIGLGATIIGTLLAEIKMSNAGLGFLIGEAYEFSRIPEMYSVLAVIFVLAWICNAGMDQLSKRLTRYY